MNPINDQIREQWKTFEKLFGGKVPFLNNEHVEKMLKDPQWIEKYVQDVLKRALPGASSNFSLTSGIDPEVFETHRAVIVRIPIPDKTDASRIKLHATRYRLRLAGLAEGDPVDIRLPAAVNPQLCRAHYKNGILEIRISKDNHDDVERPVQIHFD